MGVVAHVPQQLDDARTRLRLDHPGEPHPIDRTTLYVTRETELMVRGPGGDFAPGVIDDIRVGTSIRFWTTDVEFRSYPVQQYATRIEAER